MKNLVRKKYKHLNVQKLELGTFQLLGEILKVADNFVEYQILSLLETLSTKLLEMYFQFHA